MPIPPRCVANRRVYRLVLDVGGSGTAASSSSNGTGKPVPSSEPVLSTPTSQLGYLFVQGKVNGCL